MKLCILGATGGTGQELVKAALAQGHQVNAYARTPSKLSIQDDNLTIVQGDLDNQAQLKAAMAGVDAVVSGLGPTHNRPERTMTRGINNVLVAMKSQGVKRLVLATGAGVPDPQDNPKLLNKFITLAMKVMAKNTLEDSIGMVEAVRASDREWVIVRGPRLTDDPKKGEVKVGYVGDPVLSTSLTRADFAAFMLAQVDDDTWLRKAPAISN